MLDKLKALSTTTKGLIIGGTVVLVGGIIYFATRKPSTDISSTEKDMGGSAKDGTGTGVVNPSTTPVAPVTPAAASPAEGSAIIYISPRNENGKVLDPNIIEVRTGDAVLAVGDVVQLSTPNYNGQFPVSAIWDSGDGTGSAMINTPYKDTGLKDSAGVPIDRSAGTITVVGQASPVLNASGGRRVFYFTPAQASKRKAKKVAGKARGLKGKSLRQFIRSK